MREGTGNGRRGDGETERRRDGEKGRYNLPCLPIYPSLCLSVSPSLRLSVPIPHSLLPIFRDELDGGEADHGPLVDIPLVVAQHVALNVLDVPHRTQESVKRREPAPFQTILSGFDHLEKLVAVAIADAIQTLLIFLSHFQNLVLIAAGDQIVAVSDADVGQVDTHHPEEARTVGFGHFAERVEEAQHVVVSLRRFAGA